MPAQLTATRSGASSSFAAATAAATDCSSETSVLAKTPPTESAIVLPRSALRSATITLQPAAARPRAVASPRPLAPPETIADVPFKFMAGAYCANGARADEGCGRPTASGPRWQAARPAVAALSEPPPSIEPGGRTETGPGSEAGRKPDAMSRSGNSGGPAERCSPCGPGRVRPGAGMCMYGSGEG